MDDGLKGMSVYRISDDKKGRILNVARDEDKLPVIIRVQWLDGGCAWMSPDDISLTNDF